jgi:hypothetical protein
VAVEVALEVEVVAAEADAGAVGEGEVDAVELAAGDLVEEPTVDFVGLAEAVVDNVDEEVEKAVAVDDRVEVAEAVKVAAADGDVVGLGAAEAVGGPHSGARPSIHAQVPSAADRTMVPGVPTAPATHAKVNAEVNGDPT